MTRGAHPHSPPTSPNSGHFLTDLAPLERAFAGMAAPCFPRKYGCPLLSRCMIRERPVDFFGPGSFQTRIRVREIRMRSRYQLLMLVAVAVVVFFEILPHRVFAEGAPAPALTGQVTSDEEGPMEGVVVSAKLDGSTITVSVYSDKQGHYSFTANRLEPGHYKLKIRAVVSDLEGPGVADLVAQKTTTVDLKLR